MYITADKLFTYVSAILHRSQVSVQKEAPFWQTICDQACSDAYGYIVRGLTARGYGSASQVPLWDDGANFQKAIGAFLALETGGALGAYDDKFVEKLDRREELKTVQVTIGGKWQAPDGTGGSPFAITGGQLDSSGDEFVPFDPNDPRRGEPTRW